MFRCATTERSHLAAFLVMKGPDNFTQLRDSIKKYVKNFDAFEHNAAMASTVGYSLDRSSSFGSGPVVRSAAVGPSREDVKSVETRNRDGLDILIS